jgi:hypothetical protein
VAGRAPASVRRVAVVLLTLIAASAAIPGAALALGTTTSPFAPGLPQSAPTTTTTSTPTVSNTSTTSDSGLNGSGAIAIAIGALVVLGGISFFIWRDARKRAPVRAAAALAAEGARQGSKAKPKPRKLSPAERKRRKRGRAR